MSLSRDQERIIAQTAYCLRIRGDYGSEAKAVKAALNRKAIHGLSRELVEEALAEQFSVLERTQQLVRTVLGRCSKSFHPHLTGEEFETGTQFIQSELSREFPRLESSIEYMMGMLWHMPRAR